MKKRHLIPALVLGTALLLNGCPQQTQPVIGTEVEGPQKPDDPWHDPWQNWDGIVVGGCEDKKCHEMAWEYFREVEYQRRLKCDKECTSLVWDDHSSAVDSEFRKKLLSSYFNRDGKRCHEESELWSKENQSGLNPFVRLRRPDGSKMLLPCFSNQDIYNATNASLNLIKSLHPSVNANTLGD